MKLIINENDFKHHRKSEAAIFMSPRAVSDFRGWFTAAFAGLAIYELTCAHYLIGLLSLIGGVAYWFLASAVVNKLGARRRRSAAPPVPGDALSSVLRPRLLASGMTFAALIVPIGLLHTTTVVGEEAAQHDEARVSSLQGLLARKRSERLTTESLKKAQQEQARLEQSRIEAARARAEEAKKQDQMLDVALNKYEAALWKDISLGHLKDVRHGRDTVWSIVHLDAPARHTYGLKIVDPIRKNPAGVVIAHYTKEELEGLIQSLTQAEAWAIKAERIAIIDGHAQPVPVDEGIHAASQVMACKMMGSIPLVVVDPPFGNLFLAMDQVRILKAALTNAVTDINRLENEAVEQAVADVKSPTKKNLYL